VKGRKTEQGKVSFGAAGAALLVSLLSACVDGGGRGGATPAVDPDNAEAIDRSVGEMLASVEPSPIKVARDAVVLIPCLNRVEKQTQTFGMPVWGLPGGDDALKERRQTEALLSYRSERALAEAIARADIFSSVQILEVPRFPDPAPQLAAGSVVVASTYELQERDEEHTWLLYRLTGSEGVPLKVQYEPGRLRGETLNAWLQALARQASAAADGPVS